jgi:hypothetical protein
MVPVAWPVRAIDLVTVTAVVARRPEASALRNHAGIGCVAITGLLTKPLRVPACQRSARVALVALFGLFVGGSIGVFRRV